jgi:hypothetical protein
MNAPSEDELAVIVAAYAMLRRNAAPPPDPTPPHWRRSGRADLGNGVRASSWRAAGRRFE